MAHAGMRQPERSPWDAATSTMTMAVSQSQPRWFWTPAWLTNHLIRVLDCPKASERKPEVLKMKWNAAHAVSAAFAIALTAALTGQAYAGSCERGQRIDHNDAGCLRAEWDNNTNLWSEGKVEAQSKCSDYGTVVVKVDRKAATDYTWHLTNNRTRHKSTGAIDVRGVYCCSDLSDLCDKSEVDDDSCLDRFRSSSADDTCKNESASIDGLHQCTIEADCETYQQTSLSGDPQTWYEEASITVHWSDVDDLHNCKGELELGGCS